MTTDKTYQVLVRHPPTKSWGIGPTLRVAMQQLRKAASESRKAQGRDRPPIHAEACVISFTDAEALELDDFNGTLLAAKGGTFLVTAYPGDKEVLTDCDWDGAVLRKNLMSFVNLKG